MKRLTATRALELTVDQWALMLQGMGKMEAASKVAHRMHINHSCFLCEYSSRKGDEAAWDFPRKHITCPHCPYYIIAGHCMDSKSPYAAWASATTSQKDPKLTEMVISGILGVQAEWKRIHGRKGSKVVL